MKEDFHSQAAKVTDSEHSGTKMLFSKAAMSMKLCRQRLQGWKLKIQKHFKTLKYIYYVVVSTIKVCKLHFFYPWSQCSVKTFLLISVRFAFCEINLRFELTHSSAGSGTWWNRHIQRKRPPQCSWCCLILGRDVGVGGGLVGTRLVFDASRCRPNVNIGDFL